MAETGSGIPELAALDWGARDNVHIRAGMDPCRRLIGIRLFYRDKFRQDQPFVVRRLIPEAILEGESWPAPCHVGIESATELMDDLWNAGVRPSNVLYRDETTSAIVRHLNDMRAIVAAKLDVKLP